MGNFAVIPMKDQVHYTRDLVEQLWEQQECDGIVICDNGSTEPASRQFFDATHAHGTCPTWVYDCAGWNIHQMWNFGVATALTYDREPNVAILNNDLRIGPHFLSTLAAGLRAYDDLWVVCPNYDRRVMPAAMVQIRDVCAGKYDGTGGLSGFAFMLKGELVGNRLPWFDENLQWYCGDNQLAVETDRRGGQMAMVGRTWVEHLDGGSRTINDRPPEFKAVLETDLAYFQKAYNVRLVAR